jgi:hypothetical protein
VLHSVDTGTKPWNMEYKNIHINAHGKNISRKFLSGGLIISLLSLAQLDSAWVPGTIGITVAIIGYLPIRLSVNTDSSV